MLIEFPFELLSVESESIEGRAKGGVLEREFLEGLGVGVGIGGSGWRGGRGRRARADATKEKSDQLAGDKERFL